MPAVPYVAAEVSAPKYAVMGIIALETKATPQNAKPGLIVRIVGGLAGLRPSAADRA